MAQIRGRLTPQCRQTAARRWFVTWRKRVCSSRPSRMHIIEAAKAGDPDAIEVLRALLLECKAKRVDMPSDLIGYDMHVTAHGERRHQRPGPKKKSYILRDICIAMTVAALVDRYGQHGITATGDITTTASLVLRHRR